MIHNVGTLSQEVTTMLKYNIYSSIFQESKSFLTNVILSSFFEKAKRRYGTNFVFKKKDDNIMVQAQVLYKWIEKYDEDFDKRTKNKVTGCLTDQVFMINLDINTFALILTGDYADYRKRYNNYSSRDNDFGYDNISIVIFGKRAKRYIDELQKMLDDIMPSADKLYTYNVSGNASKDPGKGGDELNSIVSNMNCRDIETLFYNKGVKEGVLNHIDSFIENKEIYEKRNLLHKTGILLYGNPGTGKTSLAAAIATKYKYDLIIIDMGTFDRLDLNTLTNCINSDTKNFVVLLEDIDTIYNLNRDENGEQIADKDDKKIINKMLQFLDSSTSPNNVIFIATSNYPDRLDDAILRAGRFDYKANIGPITTDIARVMCTSFEVPDNAIDAIIEKSKDKNNLCNQSKLQNYILEHFKKELRGDEYIEKEVSEYDETSQEVQEG